MTAVTPEQSLETAAPGAGRRIMIDALAARFGGTAYAAVQLARHLSKRSEVATVLVLSRGGSIVERGLAHEPAITCVSPPDVSRNELVERIAWQASRVPALAAREGCDVVISMSGMLPRLPRCAVVCLLFNPVMYESRTAANALRRWAVRRTTRQATYVAAPSRLMAALASPSIGRECAVVPLGVDHSVFAPADDPGGEILCVADFYKHKRHDVLLDAWLRLAAPRPRLRLIGNPAVDPGAHASLLARIAALPEGDSIVLEHQVPLDRLVRAYQRARVFVMPSERESFCMPLVESMACGVPAVVRGIPSLRETGGGGARYVADDDPVHWAAVMGRLIDDDHEHVRARELAIRAAARFSWETFAATLAAHL
jgi:glycosyltransferase involved in cell wall biosynthesis